MAHCLGKIPSPCSADSSNVARNREGSGSGAFFLDHGSQREADLKYICSLIKEGIKVKDEGYFWCGGKGARGYDCR